MEIRSDSLGKVTEEEICGEVHSKHILSVDLEELVQDYVWKIYMEDINFLKKVYVRHSKNKEDMHQRWFLRRRNLYVDISWGYVDFEHNTEVTERQREGQTKESVQLYVCEYENRTNEEHVNTFNTSRQTMSSTNVELHDSFNVGANMNLSLNLSNDASLGIALERELSVTNTNAQGFSEVLTWDNTTEVKIPPWHRAKASLHALEGPSTYDFKTTTTVSLPYGKLPCSVRRRSDDKVIRIYNLMSLRAIVPQYLLDKEKVIIRNGQGSNTHMIDVQLELKTTGVCRNVSSQRQRILIECEKIERTTESDIGQKIEQARAGDTGKKIEHKAESDKKQEIERKKEIYTSKKVDYTTEMDIFMKIEPTTQNDEDEYIELTTEDGKDMEMKRMADIDYYQITEHTTETD